MVLLRNVSRRDSGLYECVSTDTDTFAEVSGNMMLSVNCEHSAVVGLVFKSAPAFNSHCT